ncbi:hypothetical protein [uncultured Shewanella sp.]|nr:hypothetical protein [uncultured Shewanella sp.]
MERRLTVGDDFIEGLRKGMANGICPFMRLLKDENRQLDGFHLNLLR